MNADDARFPLTLRIGLAGPYDGTIGSVGKFNITSQTWKDITPVSAPYFGFGGLAVDLQKTGTIMVATVNSWWFVSALYSLARASS